MSNNEKDPNSQFNVNKFNSEYTVNGKNITEYKEHLRSEMAALGMSPEEINAVCDWDNFTALDPTDPDFLGGSVSLGRPTTVSARTTSNLVDGSDALANSGFTVSFMHVPSESTVFFKAFLTAFNETFKPSWTEETVYGRADGIYMFKNTSRNITVGLTIPAATMGEGIENLGRLQQLVQFLYPTYASADNALTITQSPLVRLKVMNITTKDTMSINAEGNGFSRNENNPASDFINTNKAEDGLMGIMNNLSINYNVENPDFGAFQLVAGTIVPKSIEINFDFTVIHEHHLGWSDQGEFSSPNYPYNIDVKGRAQDQNQMANTYALAEGKKAREEAEALEKRAAAVEAAQTEREQNALAKAGRAVHKFFFPKDPQTRRQKRSAAEAESLLAQSAAATERAEGLEASRGTEGNSVSDLYTDYLID